MTLYDQSGKNAHATAASTASAPKYNATSKLLDFIGTFRLALPNSTLPTGDGSYTVSFKHGTVSTVAQSANRGVLGSGTAGTPNNVLSFNIANFSSPNNSYENYWWANDFTYTQTPPVAPGSVATFTYQTGAGTNSRNFYLNGSLVASNTPLAPRTSTAGNNFIGMGDTTFNNYLGGELYYVAIFDSVLSAGDRAIVQAQ
jgi:hypothetical protein